MRYILKRDYSSDWGIWDTRKQIFHCTGLTVEEARDSAKNLNDENEREVKDFLGT